ncbi:SseB family protein [Nocardioides solisilvae]|uniref:SseB family protein n=1 Tax=Nocardioides solisilvae TaxID=1542435 RepID=UPI000D74D49C|nr:SseB family protein [Nocardioides solisilvae]
MVDSPRFDGARILQPGFPGDTGSADPAVARALADHRGAGAGAETFALAVRALAGSRLLVPVVAVLGEVEVDERGLAHDKSSDMAAVLLTGADGRVALLAFTSTDALTAWDPAARPVPVAAEVAALSAVQEGADALVVDVAGPATFVLEGQDLEAFGAGWELARVGDRYGWLRPEE